MFEEIGATMNKQIVVLFGLNAEHTKITETNGVAFPLGKLLHEGFCAIYVAKSDADAEAAIAHYSQEGTLGKFTETTPTKPNDKESSNES